MARGAAVTGSLVAHAIALVIALITRRGPDRAQPPTAAPAQVAPVQVELLAAPPAPPVAAAPAAGAVAAGYPGTPRQARPSGAAGAIATRAARPSIPDAIEVTLRVEPRTGGAGPGDGGGDGTGLGLGLGAGSGAGPPPPELLRLPVPATPEPTAPVVSLARPPRLLYPARHRDAGDAAFVARLTIDDDGFVVGARLVHGVGGSRDDQAQAAVWRFRYSPALDDGGRPVAATIDQPFLVD